MAKFDAQGRSAAREARERLKTVDGLLPSYGLELSGDAAARVKARLVEMPVNCRRTYLRALGGKAPRSAIRAFCQMCMGWRRGEIESCSDPACPLFPYRPSW